MTCVFLCRNVIGMVILSPSYQYPSTDKPEKDTYVVKHLYSCLYTCSYVIFYHVYCCFVQLCHYHGTLSVVRCFYKHKSYGILRISIHGIHLCNQFPAICFCVIRLHVNPAQVETLDLYLTTSSKLGAWWWGRYCGCYNCWSSCSDGDCNRLCWIGWWFYNYCIILNILHYGIFAYLVKNRIDITVILIYR